MSREGSFGENAELSVVTWVPAIEALVSVPIMVRGMPATAETVIRLSAVNLVRGTVVGADQAQPLPNAVVGK